MNSDQNIENGVPEEFEVVFAVDMFGNYQIIKIPFEWIEFMNGSSLEDNGFQCENLPKQQGLYQAYCKAWHTIDWETGYCDHFGFDMTNVVKIWNVQ